MFDCPWAASGGGNGTGDARPLTQSGNSQLRVILSIQLKFRKNGVIFPPLLQPQAVPSLFLFSTHPIQESLESSG